MKFVIRGTVSYTLTYNVVQVTQYTVNIVKFEDGYSASK